MILGRGVLFAEGEERLFTKTFTVFLQAHAISIRQATITEGSVESCNQLSLRLTFVHLVPSSSNTLTR